MVKTTTIVKKNLQNEFSRRYVIASSVCLVVGVVGILLYAFRDSIFGNMVTWPNIFLIAAVPLGIGLLLTFLVVKTKNTTKVDEREIAYEFSEGGIDAVIKRGDVVTDAKIAYADVSKVKQTKNFWFIYLKDGVSFPVDARNLSKEESATVKVYLGINKK